MMQHKIAIGCDHAGFPLKAALTAALSAFGHEVLDKGTNGPGRVDYPDHAHAVCRAVEAGEAKFGVLVCGSGIGMSIAANRHSAIRAALVHDGTGARLARQHNDANVLVLGGRVLGIEVAKDCLKTFFTTEFEGGRHARRVAKMS